MADIKVRFELNENANEESIGTVKTNNLTFANTSIEPNAAGVFNNMPTRDNTTKGINALTFGQDLYFNENGMLDNVDDYGGGLDSEKNKFEIVWGVVNPDNTYNVKITFENAENLKDIVVYGDKESQQFPTRAILDGTTEVFSDDYIWTLQFPSESNTHTIEFTHWNRANYNAVLTFIGVMLKYIEIDKRNGLKSIESLSQSTGQPKEIFYGLVPSDGSLQIVDVNGEIADMVKDNIIPNSNLNIQLFVNDNLIREHSSYGTEYEVETKHLLIDVSDMIKTLENFIVKDRVQVGSISLYNVLLDVMLQWGKTEPEVDEMCDSLIRVKITKDVDNNQINKEIIQTIKEYLSNIYLSSFYYEQKSIATIIDYICNIAQINCYIEHNNLIKFVSNSPIYIGDDKIIHIPLKNQCSAVNYELITNNNYTGVGFSDIRQSSRVGENFVIESTFIDENGNIIYDTLGDIGIDDENSKIKIINDGSQKYLCFYKTIISSNYMIDSIGKIIIKQYSSDDTFEELDEYPSVSDKSYYTYDFYDSNTNVVTKLNKYTKFNTVLLAFKVPLSNNFTTHRINVNVSLTSIKNENSNLVIGNDKNVFAFKTNELFSKGTSYRYYAGYQDWRNIPLTSIIYHNICSQYANGIKTINFSMNCSNLLDSENNIVKDWSVGEILNVGDIIQIDRDNNKNSLFNDSIGNPILFKVTGCKFRNKGVPLLDIEAQEIIHKEKEYQSSFSVDDWSKISNISKSGLAAFAYNIGDEKTITLSTGEKVVLTIMEVASNSIIIGTKYVLNTKYATTNSQYTSSYWHESYMRNVVMKQILEQLPIELSNIIEPRNIRTYHGNTYTTTRDYIWLYSPNRDSIDYYNSIENRIKTLENSATPVQWATRDVSSSGSDKTIMLINENGKETVADSGVSHYISFLFSV